MSTHSKCKQDQPTYGLALMCNTANEPQRTDLLNAFTAADKLCTQTRQQIMRLIPTQSTSQSTIVHAKQRLNFRPRGVYENGTQEAIPTSHPPECNSRNLQCNECHRSHKCVLFFQKKIAISHCFCMAQTVNISFIIVETGPKAQKLINLSYSTKLIGPLIFSGTPSTSIVDIFLSFGNI